MSAAKLDALDFVIDLLTEKLEQVERIASQLERFADIIDQIDRDEMLTRFGGFEEDNL